jgi:hypothetical protein
MDSERPPIYQNYGELNQSVHIEKKKPAAAAKKLVPVAANPEPAGA